jgi:hypothetical protein
MSIIPQVKYTSHWVSSKVQIHKDLLYILSADDSQFILLQRILSENQSPLHFNHYLPDILRIYMSTLEQKQKVSQLAQVMNLCSDYY